MPSSRLRSRHANAPAQGGILCSQFGVKAKRPALPGVDNLLGAPKSAISSALDDIDSSPIAEKMKPVLRYARKLTEKPDSLTQTDADAIYAAGWNEAALYQTAAVTALFNLMNRLVEGTGIELDASYVKPASERLAKTGYLPLIEMMRR